MVSAFLKKLMFARQFDIDGGKITVLGQQQVMLPSELIFEMQEIDSKRVYNFTKERTKVMIGNYFKRIGTSFARSDNVVCDIFNNFGLGKLEIIENSKVKSTVKVFDSTIALDFMKKNKGFTNKPVCGVTAATLAGMFSFLNSKDLNATEVECHAKRDVACKFVIK